jgi:RimJ/RimL family protein N-acetyltransferase
VGGIKKELKMKNTTIKTERLTLDRIKSEDADDLIEIFRHDKVKATYMLPDLDDDNAAQALFDRIRILSERDDKYVRGIYLNDKLIGIINDTEIISRSIELGYAIHPRFHSKGYATEALNAMINYLFDLGFEEIITGAFEENAASIRVMQKCGMTRLSKTDSIDYRAKTHNCVYFSIKKSNATAN